MHRAPILAFLVLAACGADPVRPPADDATPEAPAATNAAAPTALPAIPVRFVGRWDRDAAACREATRGELRLDVTADALRFYESEGRAVTVADLGDGTTEVEAVMAGEGVTEQRRYRLALGPGGALDVTAGGGTARRVRCDAPTGAREATRGGTLGLAPDGLQVVHGTAARILPFGTAADTVLRAAEAASHALPERGRNGECGAGPLDHATFPGIRLWFQDGRFVGWDARGRTLTTMAGVGIGVPRTTVEGAIDARVAETSLGTEFNAGTLSGLYEGERVAALWAGTTCVMR